jgi:hypothetical protein
MYIYYLKILFLSKLLSTEPFIEVKTEIRYDKLYILFKAK